MAFQASGLKWGNGTLGSSGGQVTWSFGSGAGNFYNFDARISDPNFQQAVRDAFTQWEQVASIDCVEVSASATSNIVLGWDSIDGAFNTVGEATYSFIGNVIQHAEIVFDLAETWSLGASNSAINFYAVALHEIGHAFGLDHAENSLMSPYVSFDDLTADDVAGARYIYGPNTSQGTEDSDNYLGDSGNNVYAGRGGNDLIQGESGNDELRGGNGEDRIEGGVGADRLWGDNGHDTIFGGAGGDQLVGGRDNDTLYGEGDDDTLWGEHGDDALVGGAGKDHLYGQDGRDTLWGELGDDRLIGGSNDDVLFGQDGHDVIWGEDGHDRLIGGEGNDIVYGQADYDTLFGENGNDQLFGGLGNDVLYGQANDDQIQGEAGQDFLSGGAGSDQLFGGLGADSFYFGSLFEGTDTILDFSHAEGDNFFLKASEFAAPIGFQLTTGVGFLVGVGVNSVAETATVMFDSQSNYLWFDPDGTGASNRSLIAFLPDSPAMQVSDFFFI